MSAPRVMSCSRAYPVTGAQAFDVVLSTPLEGLFDRRYGPLPPIRGVEGQDGPWGHVGQTRTVRLSDGGSMREQLTTVERPDAFGYVLTDVTGPMKPLATRIEGLWSFEPAGTGVRVTWQWTVHPASTVSARMLPLFSTLWRGYARQVLQHLEDILLAA